MNNSDHENLLTLQRVFLTPRQNDPNGLYLDVDVTVEGRVTDDDDSYWIHEYCDSYCPQNSLCVYSTLMIFEVLPTTNQDSTVEAFLNENEIRMVLQVLDPSFHSLARMFRTSRDSYYTTDYCCHLNFYTHVDNVEIVLDELPTDVRNALYLTLSWVSLKQCNLELA